MSPLTAEQKSAGGVTEQQATEFPATNPLTQKATNIRNYSMNRTTKIKSANIPLLGVGALGAGLIGAGVGANHVVSSYNKQPLHRRIGAAFYNPSLPDLVGKSLGMGRSSPSFSERVQDTAGRAVDHLRNLQPDDYYRYGGGLGGGILAAVLASNINNQPGRPMQNLFNTGLMTAAGASLGSMAGDYIHKHMDKKYK